MQHFVVVGILVLVMAVLTYLGLDAAGLATQMHPVAGSAQAASIDRLWNWEMIVISFLFSLIVVPLVYSLVVFRRRKGDATDAEHVEGNTTLEVSWTVVPLIIVMVFAYLGAYSLGEVRRVDPQAFVVNVKAQQFSWTFEYPEYGIVSNELYLPVNKQVVFRMESSDVIHSFWGPRMAHQTGRCAGPRDRIPHHPDAGGQVQSPLCRVVRYDTLRYGRTDCGRRSGGI
ncbi:MAG: cytochrome c oxidase subunit II [Chloroflexi bacterium]|nr:cytochrome c oxidase subunit II [Chloroflexota bacterium]